MGVNDLGVNSYFTTPVGMQYQRMLMQMSQEMALQAQAQQIAQGQQTQQNGLPANQGITQPTFKGGAPVSAEKQIQTQNKKGMSKAGKWAVGLGTTAVGLVTAATLISKGQCAKIAKLYQEKLIPKKFAEKLEFKKAETIEDAIKFAKEKLGIKEVDSLFTAENHGLEALNSINKGVTDVVNANIGQEVFVPVKYKFPSLKDSTLASVNSSIKSSEFGTLSVNSQWFKPEYIDNELKEILGLNKKTADDIAKNAGQNKSAERSIISWVSDNELVEIQNKFKQDSSSISIEDKLKLYESLNGGRRKAIIDNFYANPIETLEYNKKLFKDLGIEINYDEISKLPATEQGKKVVEILKEKLPDGEFLQLYVKPRGYEETIYHELGHLQDFAKNLKELDIAKWKFDPVQIWKDSWNAAKNGIKHDTKYEMDALNNHWGGTTYKGFKELLEKDPDKFKKLYPDLYEHLKNEEIQKTAGKVSAYAQTSIGEFIAETYAKMVSGDTIPDDVLKLYKKYNGPLPKAFAA